MPDPSWTFTYNKAQDPEGNGFTALVSGATVNAITSGPPAGRRLEIDTSGGGSAIYQLGTEPTGFDPSVGITGELQISVTGGNAGFEFTFLDRALLLDVRDDVIELNAPDGTDVLYAVDMTVERVLRVTLDSSGDARAYVDGSLVIGPTSIVASSTKDARRFLFWHERFAGSGGLATFREMKAYDGGAVAPG